METEGSRRLEENFHQLKIQVLELKAVRESLKISGEQRLSEWLQNVQDQEKELEEISTKLDKLEKKSSYLISGAKFKLNKKVIESLHAAVVLKEKGEAISVSVEVFISEIATTKAPRYTQVQLEKYMSKEKILIGSGEFGDVYKARLLNGSQIAVKVLKLKEIEDIEKQFMAEVSTMSKTYHRNLVRLYGYCFDPNMKALVYEFLEGGSLENILSENHLRVKWPSLYGVAVGTARALSYLHEHCNEHIIHRDIKCGNVLLDSNLVPKLSDFGLARLYSTDKSSTKTIFKRAHSYDAPEVRGGWKLTFKCDVFSFGMMFLDVLKRIRNKTCVEQQSFAREVWEKFEKGELDQIMEECGINQEKDRESAKRLVRIALCCIHDVSDKRPSMSTVLKALQEEMQLLPPGCPFIY